MKSLILITVNNNDTLRYKANSIYFTTNISERFDFLSFSKSQ